MLETILDYEEVKEILEEEAKKTKLGLKKIALMHKDTILQLYELDTDIENIERRAIKIAKNTLQLNNIDLCYIIIDKIRYDIVYKNIMIHDIIREEYENYQRINDNIYTLDAKELKNELWDYSEKIFNKILDDAYFKISDTATYNDCIGWIFEEIENEYENGYTIFTSKNSFLLYGNYLDVITTDFEDDYYILNKDTKLFLIDEIGHSDLSENIKEEIIKKIAKY